MIVKEQAGGVIIDPFSNVGPNRRNFAAFMSTVSTREGEISFQGNCCTPEGIQKIKDAFGVALAVVEAEVELKE